MKIYCQSSEYKSKEISRSRLNFRLRIADSSIVTPLKLIFMNILRTSTYPSLWKLANVTPVHKKDDKQVIKNYRPISLLPLYGKIFEKILFNDIYAYLSSNNLITKNLSGFRPGDSTTNQLLYLISEIHECFDNPKSLEVRAEFLDISKAFDKVWHEGLLFKLKQNGIHGKLLDMFQSYLEGRQQRVVLNGSHSPYTGIRSGVPQGSVLGPLLFLVYINDLEKNIISNVKFFADDTMLYSIVNDISGSANDLNHDLELIRRWAHQWKMQFNPDPTKQANEIILSRKRAKPNHPPLSFNGNPVANTDEQKHLGLTLSPNLYFQKHINGKIIKAKKMIGLIKHLSMYLPVKALNQMYKSFVRPHLDYCDVILHEPHKIDQFGLRLTSSMEEIEKIHYKAALAVTGTWQGTSRSKLYEELGWESQTDRRTLRRFLMMHKIVNNCTPSYLKDQLLRIARAPVDHPIFLHEYRCRTTRFRNSFFPDTTRSWNVVMSHFSTMPTSSAFKQHLISLFRPIGKSLFNIYDPLSTKYLFQIRLGLSPLQNHKRNHNFTDTQSSACLCGTGSEDTPHFLFKCPFYASQRAALAAKVIGILINNNLNHLGNTVSIYLFGHFSLADHENRSII